LVVDPMCGCGTIGQIASVEFTQCFYLIEDIDLVAIRKAANKCAALLPEVGADGPSGWIGGLAVL
jgi:hypothetical protein